MEGTQADTPPAPGPTPPHRRTRLLLVIAVVVVVVVATAFAVVYLPTRPIPLTVSDGAMVGMIEGNLTSISSGSPLGLWFNMTTYANQSGQPTSTLVMQVQTYSYYVSALGNQYLVINIAVEALGHFASNLHPSGLGLTANATGASGNSLYFWPANQTGTNASFDPNQHFGVFGTGSGQATATLSNGGGVSYDDFAYGAGFEAFEYLVHSQFIGFRVTVNGPFTPSVSVGIVVAIIDVPA